MDPLLHRRISRRAALQGGLALGAGLALPAQAFRAMAPALITARPSLRPDGPPRIGPYRVLAGSLHDHSTDSDGDSAAERIVDFLHTYRDDLGLDFCTLSDHSDFFPVPYQRLADGAQAGVPSSVTPVGDLWHRQLGLAARYRGEEFSFIHGFEWTNDQENHLNVLLSQNWTSRFVTGDASLHMDPFWTWLATTPTADPSGAGLGFGGADGIGMFNHPGDKGALNWDDYGYSAGAAQQMALIEIHGSYGKDGRLDSDAGWYWFALSRGWHVSPVMDWDWHNWSADGVLSNPTPGAGYDDGNTFLPGQRSLVVATNSLPESIREALAARRTTATEIPDLWATLRGPEGEWQGSIIEAEPGEKLRLRIDAGSPTEPLLGVQIVSDNGIDGHSHYYGDNADWLASHSQLTISYVEQHRRYVTSNGNATMKRLPGGGRHDGPPDGTVVASAPLQGQRAHTIVEVRVPTAPSPRPDGRHFFYAIVYAGKPEFAARAWTGPLLTTSGSHRGEDGEAAAATRAARPRWEPTRTASTAPATPLLSAMPRRGCGCRA